MPKKVPPGVTAYGTAKGERWQYVLDLGRDPITGARKQERRRGFTTADEAQAALEDARSAVRQGTHVGTSQVKVGDYLMQWIDTKEANGLAAKSASSYRQIVRDYVLPRLGQRLLQELTAHDLDGVYADLLRSGDKQGRPLSARTVRYTHTVVSGALSAATRKRLVPRNVALDAEPPSAKAARAPEKSVWTPAQLKVFLNATEDHRLHLLFRTAATTGMRRGELCGLAWRQVDLNAGSLRVTQALTVVDGRPEFGPPKSDQSRRTIDLDPKTRDRLRRHRRNQMEARLEAGTVWEDSGLVFTNDRGGHLHPDNVSAQFVQAVTSLQPALPRITLHGLRHTHATHLLATGANPRIVSERLGHHSVAFTLDTYGHVLPGQQSDAARAVADLVDSA